MLIKNKEKSVETCMKSKFNELNKIELNQVGLVSAKQLNKNKEEKKPVITKIKDPSQASTHLLLDPVQIDVKRRYLK